MSHALIAAAAEAGIRLTLLDTCYLAGGFGHEPGLVQRRFSDGDAERWAQRVDGLHTQGVVLGAAVHSVRAVPEEQIPVVTAWSQRRNAPLHMHLSEQRKENAQCHDYYGRTPATVLANAGALGEHTVAIHATHLCDDDIALLGRTGVRACLCPTTERDLGDGIGPATALRDASVGLCIGSDSHAVIDPFEEMRGLEMSERLATEQRGHFMSEELLAATAADVRQVLVGGRVVVTDGSHTLLDDVPGSLAKEMALLWDRS